MARAQPTRNFEVEGRRGRATLTLAMLDRLGPRKAAAYFTARRPEGLTRKEQRLLSDWLAADAAHRAALACAEHAWQIFDKPSDHETLAAMRDQALAARPRTRMGWRVVVGAAVIALTAGFAVAGLISRE